MNWEQLKTIVWLRWRLSVNQWKKGGGLGGAIAAIIGVGAVVLGLISFLASLLIGALALDQAPPLGVMGVWLGIAIVFVFFWTIGVIAELQRSEIVDLRRLLHLPVGLGQMFCVNFVASHFALSIILLVPAMLGLALGFTISQGFLMILLAPLALSFVFMLTAWTYCFRGWLAGLMANPRKRRTIIMTVTVGFILIAQLPNIFFNVFNRHQISPPREATQQEKQRFWKDRKAAKKTRMDGFVATQQYIPILWLPAGAHKLAEGRAGPALLMTLGGLAIGGLGLLQAYRSTLRFYRGEVPAKPGTQPRTPPAAERSSRARSPDQRRALFMERRLPGVPEQAAALALATFRSLLRAPEAKMAIATPFIVMAIIGAMIAFRSSGEFPNAAKPFLATASVVIPFLMMQQFLGNVFGLDRDGFRALVLSPADRRHILMAKNLATLPLGGVLALVLLALVSIFLRLPLMSVLAALVQLLTVLTLAGIIGNLLSILVPYRMEPGTMKPTKMPFSAILLMALCHLTFPLMASPVFVPALVQLLWTLAGGPAVLPVNLLLSCVILGLAVLGYRLALPRLARLLRSRETRILSIVASATE